MVEEKKGGGEERRRGKGGGGRVKWWGWSRGMEKGGGIHEEGQVWWQCKVSKRIRKTRKLREKMENKKIYDSGGNITSRIKFIY